MKLRNRVVLPLIRGLRRVIVGGTAAPVHPPFSPRGVLIRLLRPFYRWIRRRTAPAGVFEYPFRGVTLFLDGRDLGASAIWINRPDFDVIERGLVQVQGFLKPGDWAVDVGANYGLYTVLMAQAVGPEGHVYAFEPHPHVRGLLQRSIEKSGFSQVTVLPYAVGSQSGKAAFVIEKESGLSHLGQENVDRGTMMVEVVTLDEFFKNRPRTIRLLKIDVEGAEPLVVQGAKNLLESNSEIVVLSEVSVYHQRYGVSLDEYLDLLLSMKFDIYWMDRRTDELVKLSPNGREALYLVVNRFNSTNIVCGRGEAVSRIPSM